MKLHASTLAALLLLSTTASAANCIDEAAAYYQVNPLVLRAIAIVESSARPGAVNINVNGSMDRGMYQINSIHLNELSGVGIVPADLHDVCLSSYIASLLLKRHKLRFGDTWAAVGAYHSTTPEKRDAYSRKVRVVFNMMKAATRSSNG